MNAYSTRFARGSSILLLLGSASCRAAHADPNAADASATDGATLPGDASCDIPAIGPTDRVYSADQTSNTVTVIDPSRNVVLGTIALGKSRLGGVLGPAYFGQIDTHGLGFARDGKTLDVVNVTTNSAMLIDTASNAVKDTFYVGRAPHEGFIAPDGKTLWVAVRGEDYVCVLDIGSRVEVQRIKTAKGASKVVFSPDGHLAFVSHVGAAEVDVVDVATRTVATRIPVSEIFSADLAISPEGDEVWVGHKKAGRVAIIDARARTLLATLDTGPETNHPNFITKHDGRFAYVTVGGTNETLAYRRNGATPDLVARIANHGSVPHGIWPSPDGTRLYVVLEHSDAMDVIDTDALAVVATLHIGQEPQAVVYVPGAAPAGSGDGLVRQGLDRRVAPFDVSVTNAAGKAAVTVRELETQDEVDVELAAAIPGAAYVVTAERGSFRAPLGDIRADERGTGQLLAFTRYFGVFDRVVVEKKP